MTVNSHESDKELDSLTIRGRSYMSNIDDLIRMEKLYF